MLDTASIDLIKVSVKKEIPSITIASDWILIIILLVLIVVIFLFRRFILKRIGWQKMEVEISGTPKLTFTVERNEENLYIANRIYIELTTRKAAIPIDENNDVIVEIYDSWYNLFGIIRDELKALPGKYLKNHDATSALIGISREILNKALRPHLTEHQAKFRRWWESEQQKDTNKDRSPQDIQKEYPDFDNLVDSMKAVNTTLIDYANELDKLIKGKK